MKTVRATALPTTSSTAWLPKAVSTISSPATATTPATNWSSSANSATTPPSPPNCWCN